jgi:hypothetical protein
MRKTILAIAVLLVACDTASVPLATTQADADGKKFGAPPSGEATLYVVRGGDVGTLINVTVGARSLGLLGNFTWFRVDLAPGTLDVRCAGGEASKSTTVTLAAGEVRFVETRATTGLWNSRCEIGEVAAPAGRDLVLRGKRAVELR